MNLKHLLILLTITMVAGTATINAQDCSDRIQAAGRIYEKYKKNKDKTTLEEARKQLVNIKNTQGAPQKCIDEANRLLKQWKPIKAVQKSNSTDVAPIIVHLDTIVEKTIHVDSVVNIIIKYDSLKVQRFYQAEADAQNCVKNKDYICAIDNYQTASAYGKELQMGESIIAAFDAKIVNNQKMQFNKLLEAAKQSEESNNFNEAKQKFEKVKNYGIDNNLLDSSRNNALDDKINNLNFMIEMFEYAEQADEYFKAHEWEMAKDEIEIALGMADDLGWKKGTITWKHKLDTINSILNAEGNIFDYSVLNSTKYEEYSSSIEEALYRALLRFDTLPEQTIKIIISVDKDGHNSTQVKADDQKISETILQELPKINLPSVSYFNQSTNAEATYEYNISVSSSTSKVKRTRKKLIQNPVILDRNQILNYLTITRDTVNLIKNINSAHPYLFGKFQFRSTTAFVNGKSQSGFHLSKYHGTGGPANVFLSMIIPGLGNHRVTFGKKSGAGTMIFFYGSIGASIGLYHHAMKPKISTFGDFTSEVKQFFKFDEIKSPKYFKELTKLDSHGNEIPLSEAEYKGRMVSYYASYSFAGLAAIIYVTDVIWTLVRGSQNAYRQNCYKKWSLGSFYDPTVNATGLRYNYKF